MLSFEENKIVEIEDTPSIKCGCGAVWYLDEEGHILDDDPAFTPWYNKYDRELLTGSTCPECRCKRYAYAYAEGYIRSDPEAMCEVVSEALGWHISEQTAEVKGTVEKLFDALKGFKEAITKNSGFDSWEDFLLDFLRCGDNDFKAYCINADDPAEVGA